MSTYCFVYEMGKRRLGADMSSSTYRLDQGDITHFVQEYVRHHLFLGSRWAKPTDICIRHEDQYPFHKADVVCDLSDIDVLSHTHARAMSFPPSPPPLSLFLSLSLSLSISRALACSVSGLARTGTFVRSTQWTRDYSPREIMLSGSIMDLCVSLCLSVDLSLSLSICPFVCLSILCIVAPFWAGFWWWW